MDKVIAKRWVRPKTEPGQPIKQGYYIETEPEQPIKQGYYIETEAEVLHWGISYEEINGGVGQYTVVWCKLPDGAVEEFHPSNIRYVV